MTNYCEYTPAHEEASNRRDRPEAVTLERVERLDNPDGATSNANVFLCADCCDREGIEVTESDDE